jgi:exodeoxyribonuclease VII large subunit
VISAVGHEIDITVCDLVADVRAATPSAAAETAVPAMADLYAALERQRSRLRSAILRRREVASIDLRNAARGMRTAAQRTVERRTTSLAAMAGRLNALSPLATLARGYSLARGDDRATLSSISQFEKGKKFELIVRDGRIEAVTERVMRPAGEEAELL